MQWTRLADENGYCRMGIEVPWAEIAADYHDIVARYARGSMAGFRPGKVPHGVIERSFREEIAAGVARLAVRRFGPEAVRESGVEALGPLEASDMECEKGKPLRARVRYLPLPEIRLPDLAGLGGDGDGTAALDRTSRRLLDLVRFEVHPQLVHGELELDGLGDSVPGSEEWTAAADRVRLMVILKKIARQEGIEADEADVQKRIAEKAEEFGTTVRALQAELEKGGGVGRLRDLLLAESTLEYLMELGGEAT